MNGGDFAGVSYGDSFQQHHNQQHRIRSMSWCDGPEITTTTNQMGEMPPIHLAQEEVTLSPDPSLGKNEVELPSCSTEVINLKKPSARKNAWGCLSYADLIAKAIESSPNQRLTLNQIYSWMVENVPYFRAKGHTNSSAGWKNSIRHNLSLHGRFVRVQNEGAGKSSWWMVNNNNRLQKTPRRRSSTLDSKSLDKKRKTSHHHTNNSHDSNDPLNNSNSCLSSFYKSPCHLQQQLPFHFQYPQQQQQRVQKLDSFETAFRSLDRSAFNNNNNNANNLNNNNNYNPLNKNITKNISMFDNFNQYNSNNIFNISTSCFRPQQPQHCLFNDITSSTHEPQELQLLNSNNKMSFNNFHDNDPKTNIHFNHNPSQIHLFHPLPHNNTNKNSMDIFSMPEEAWRTYLPPSPDQLTETVISSESLTAFLESGADSEMVDLVPPPFISINNLTHVSLSNSNLHNIDNNRNGDKSTYNNIINKTSEIINDVSRNNNNVSLSNTTFKNDVFRGIDCINNNDFNNDNTQFDYNNELRDSYIINLTTNYNNNKSVLNNLNNTNNKGKLFNFKIVPNTNNNKQNESASENNKNVSETGNNCKEDAGGVPGLNADDNYEKPLLYNILQNNNTANNFNKTFNNNNNNNNNDVLTPCSRDDFYPKIVELLSSGSDVNNNDIKTENNNNNSDNVENSVEEDEGKGGNITSSTDAQLLPCDSQEDLFEGTFDPSSPQPLHRTTVDDLDAHSYITQPEVGDTKEEEDEQDGGNKNVPSKATKRGSKNKKEV